MWVSGKTSGKMEIRDYASLFFGLLYGAGAAIAGITLMWMGLDGILSASSQVAGWVLAPIGLVLLCVGAIFIFSASLRSCTLDKGANKMRLERISVLGRKVEEHELSRISGVRVSTRVLGRRVSYGLGMVLEGGAGAVEIASGGEAKKIAREAADFLGVGLEEIRETS
jgi:hypothetical protein